jgi:uncharacterized membrane protein/membrane-bound inhibitor of C-type lysozyme
MNPLRPAALLVTFTLLASGCGRDEAPAAADTPARPAAQAGESSPAPDRPVGSYSFNAYSYDCGDLQVVVAPSQGEMTVYLPDRSVVLPQLQAASGARYGEGDVGFWGKGINTATLTLDGTDVECTLNRLRTPWDAARLRGVEFRAIGQEPGWMVEVDPEQIDLKYDYGQSTVVLPNPGREPGPDAGSFGWYARGEGHELDISVREQACSDPMSGEAFDLSVEASIDGRQLEGCGRLLR